MYDHGFEEVGFLSLLIMADSLRKILLCSSSVRWRFSLLGPFVNIIKNLILQWTGDADNQTDGCLERVVSQRVERIFHHPFIASLILTGISSHQHDSLFCLASAPGMLGVLSDRTNIITILDSGPWLAGGACSVCQGCGPRKMDLELSTSLLSSSLRCVTVAMKVS